MRLTLVTLATVCFAQPLWAAQEGAPSIQGVGTVRFPTSCVPSVRSRFNHAVALLHSFAFPDAVTEFNAVLGADPHCAMADWGLALCAWGNPFAPGVKSAAQLQRGLLAVEHARTIEPPTNRERAYIEAAARLYEHADSLDQRSRLLAYRDAMADLAARLPADTEAVIFHALAQVVAANPADQTYASQRAAGATLQRLFAVLPDHPGLAHYIIHTYDLPGLAPEGLAAAHRYSRIAPRLSHALHMPSHIYTRTGGWQESITANVAAAAAAHREAAVAEELHASDYEVYAYLQMGQDRAAQHIVEAVVTIGLGLDPAQITTGAPPAAGYYALAAIPARYTLERGSWAEAARLERVESPVPYADALTAFARALGAARIGDSLSAKRDIDDLQRLRDLLASRHEAYWSDQVDIQRLAATAWLRFAAGRSDEALVMMRAATGREAATEKSVVSPGPLAPAQELLGEMLLLLHEPVDALAAFNAALLREPNRRRSVVGALEAAREAGDTSRVIHYCRQLTELSARADTTLKHLPCS